MLLITQWSIAINKCKSGSNLVIRLRRLRRFYRTTSSSIASSYKSKKFKSRFSLFELYKAKALIKNHGIKYRSIWLSSSTKKSLVIMMKTFSPSSIQKIKFILRDGSNKNRSVCTKKNYKWLLKNHSANAI